MFNAKDKRFKLMKRIKMFTNYPSFSGKEKEIWVLCFPLEALAKGL